MGFFTDLKDDLSQAVNELVPEEEMAAQGQAGGAAEGTADPGDALASVDLSGMLDKIEEMGDLGAVPGTETDSEAEPAVEEVVTPEPMIEEALAGETLVEEVVTPEPAADEVTEEIKEEEAEPEMEEEILAETTAEKEENNGGKGKTMEVQANRVAIDETAVVTEGMTITGDVVSEGSMELIGTVNGNLDILGKLNITGTIQGNSRAAEIFAEGAKITGEVNSGGSVKIGQSSVVIGNITATSAVIAGAVKGDIDVQGPVILDTTAIVMGNIKSKSVQINNGAVIEGMCSQCYADVNPTSFFEEFKKKK